MSISKRITLLSAVLSIVFTAGTLRTFAQAVPTTAPAIYVRADAPTAQRLVVAEKHLHPEIIKLRLHATPPSAKDNVIIANYIPSKIGKKSSDADLQKLATGRAVAVRIEKDSIYDLLLPVN